MTTTSTRDTIDIETSGGFVKTNVSGRTIVEVVIQGDGTAEYRVDGRESEAVSWVEDVGPSYTGAADYMDTLETGWEELRIVCTTGTGTVDESATIILCAGGK